MVFLDNLSKKREISRFFVHTDVYLKCVGFVSLFYNERALVVDVDAKYCILNPTSFCLSLLYSFSRVSLLSIRFFHFKSL